MLDHLLASQEAKKLLKDVTERTSKTGIVNEERVRDFVKCYRAMDMLTTSQASTKATYEMESVPGMWVISIEAFDHLSICHEPLFNLAAKLANNFEVYPLVNGYIKMNITFYGLVESRGVI